MRRKVCPYCDQVMKESMYCGGCRRIVWHPQVQEVDYYLNERHAESEKHCAYHGDLRTGEVRPGTPGPQTQSVPRRQTAEKGSPPSVKFRIPASRGQEAVSNRRKADSPRQRKLIKRLRVIALTYFLLMLFGAIIKAAVKVQMKQNAGEEVTVAEASERAQKAAEETATGQSGRDLTSEEVRAAGIACNSYRHFPCTTEPVRELFEEKFNRFFGFLTEEGAIYSIYAYNREEGDRTLYSEEYEYALMQEGEIVGYAGLYFDTATSELHGISLVVLFDDEEVYSTAADLLAEVFAELELYDGERRGSEMLHELLVKGRSYDGAVAVGDMAQFTLAYVGEKGEYLRMNIFGV
ncbi:MAG: hypothetical protein HFE84_02925 [Lachnospiraceae bacterium]|nr:hypothetical protein [Lachnospiraceae bacterium]